MLPHNDGRLLLIWVLANAAAFSFAATIGPGVGAGVAGSIMALFITLESGVDNVAASVLGIAVGNCFGAIWSGLTMTGCFGFAQALVLRHRIRGPSRWRLATAAAGPLSAVLIFPMIASFDLGDGVVFLSVLQVLVIVFLALFFGSCFGGELSVRQRVLRIAAGVVSMSLIAVGVEALALLLGEYSIWVLGGAIAGGVVGYMQWIWGLRREVSRGSVMFQR